MGDLGRFKGRGPSAWAAVDVVRRSGTNSEQSLLELNSLCLATACVLKSLRTSEVEQRASGGRLEI